MSNDTPRPKECAAVKGIFADLLLTCTQLFCLEDAALVAKMTSSSGDMFYIIEQSVGGEQTMKCLVPPDVEVVEMIKLPSSSSMSSSCLLDGSDTTTTTTATRKLIFVGGNVVSVDGNKYVAPLTTRCPPPSSPSSSDEIPHILVDFELIKCLDKGKKFLEELPILNMKLNDTICRLYYRQFHEAEKLPEKLSSTLEEFMIKHSVSTNALIQKQASSKTCTSDNDVFVRRQREIQIEQKIRTMFVAHACIIQMLELYRQFRELTDTLPASCTEEVPSSSSSSSSSDSE